MPHPRAIFALVLWLASSPAAAQPKPAVEPIVNGVHTSSYPSVGYLLNDTFSCSGTLIGCSTFLTAAHCICTDSDAATGIQCQSRADLLDPATKTVWFQHAGAYAVASVSIHPGYTLGGGGDLAILRLSTPVTGIAPSPINTLSRPKPGTSAVIAGFGTSRRSLNDVGLKRAGTVVTSTCSDPELVKANFLCWNYKNPVGPAGSNSNTCVGDSGGPLFVQQDNLLALAGVTAGGTSTDCQAPDESWDSDVFRERAWIQTAAAGDLGTNSCGAPAAGGPNGIILGGSWSLSTASPEQRTSLEVPPGTTRLRVTLNGEKPLANDYDLFIKRGAPPSTASFDCKSDHDGALELCEVLNPQPGTWHILARHAAGAGGPVQVTATAFSQPAPCLPDADTACLQGGRFEVNVTWQNTSGSGVAQVMSFGGQRAENSDSAFYYFQSPTNFEMGIKVLDACIPLFGNKYWVFISGLTDQGWGVTVRDTRTGAVKNYSNAIGHLSSTFADTSAFHCQ